MRIQHIVTYQNLFDILIYIGVSWNSSNLNVFEIYANSTYYAPLPSQGQRVSRHQKLIHSVRQKHKH